MLIPGADDILTDHHVSCVVSIPVSYIKFQIQTSASVPQRTGLGPVLSHEGAKTVCSGD